MKKTSLYNYWAMASLALVAGTLHLNAANKFWTAGSGTDTTWSTALNWSPSGSPSTNDDVRFFDTGSTNGGGLFVSSVVTASTNIHSLIFGQTNNNEVHNLYISSGATLTVSGTNNNGYGIVIGTGNSTNGLCTMFAGPWPGPAPSGAGGFTISNTVSGPGTLSLNNTNNEFQVRFCDGTSGHAAILDMSQLANFTANLSRMGVGYGQSSGTTRAMGRLFLAQTNILTLAGTNTADADNLVIGSNGQNNNGNSSVAFIILGQSNRLNIDTILISGQKTPGMMGFSSNLVYAVAPTAYMRAADGVGRTALLRIGDESDAGSTSSGAIGTLYLLPGIADLMVDKMIVAKSATGGGPAATGSLVFGAGKLDVNTLMVAAQTTPVYTGNITGAVSFASTTVNVNTLLQMGVSAGAPGPRFANLILYSNATMTVGGAYQNQGTVNMFITNSTLNMLPGDDIAANIINIDGGTLATPRTVKATNALNVYNSGHITGSPVYDLGSASATWDVQAISGGSLTVNNALQGKGTINGNVIQAAGAIISPGEISSVGTLSLGGASGNLTLNDGGTLNYDLSTSGAGVNDLISTPSGTVTVNGTNNVFLKSLGGSLDTTTPYTLITSGTLVGTSNQFKVVGPLTTGRYTFAFDTTTVPNTVRLIVGGQGPANQLWVGDGVNNVWDAQGAFNWNNGASSQFFNLDNVTFGDTGSATPPVMITGSLVTGSVTVTNVAKNYAWGGSGGLSVAGQFTKSGAGSLTISNTTDNSYSSIFNITNGAVTIANNGQDTFLGGIGIYGTGSLTLSGNSSNTFVDPGLSLPVIVIGTGTTLNLNNSVNTDNGVQVQLDGTLTFNQPVNEAFGCSLIDSGVLIKQGANTLTLNGNNSLYSGSNFINGGTVIAGNGTLVLGTTAVNVTNGAALDVNGANIGGLAVTIGGAGPTGAGALVNNGPQQNTSGTTTANGIQNLILWTNATIGGNGPYTADPINNHGYMVLAGNLSTGGSNYNLTKVGLNQVTIINNNVDSALENIDVQAGYLTFQGSTTGMGDPNGTLTVHAGAILSFYNTTTPWAKNFVLNGDGTTTTLYNFNGSSTIVGPISLNGNCVVDGANTPGPMNLAGPVGGSGALIKGTATNVYILAGTNTYAGTTTVRGGGLFVDGISSTNSITVTGGDLGGIGQIIAPVTIQSGGTLAPGDIATPMGTLIISNTLTLAAGSTNFMDVSKAGAVFTSDEITNVTTLTFGGTLAINETGDPLAAGDVINLFSFAHASGSFAAFNPATPGAGLVWDQSTLTTDGNIRVKTAPVPQPVFSSVSTAPGQLILSGSNGSLGGNYYVLVSSNLLVPLSNWTYIATDAFNGDGTFSFTNNVDPTVPRQFIVIQLP
jgi:autotransporter-associated beta strand protein